MRRLSWMLVVTSLLMAGGSAASTAEAAAPPEWRSLQADIAAPYPGLATAEGRFPDYLQPRQQPFPVPTLSLALIQTGLANGDATQVDIGLRGIDDYIVHGPLDGPPGVFDHFAIATAYNLVREEQPDNPLFSANRAAWETWLRRAPMHWLPNTNHYANKYMVEVVSVLEARRSGLASTVKGSVLSDGDRAERLATHVLDDVAPTIARGASTKVAGAPALVLSDPSNNALAYHALTLGFFGRAVDLLGPRASAGARESLQRVARASWALTGPDGDLAYIGRSQEQGWALALTAYGAEVAADDADATWAPRFRAVADRALARLRAVHGAGPQGMWITPAGAAGAGAGRGGLDTYANGPGYSGLALVGLNWAVEHAERHDRPSGAIAADAPGAWRLANGRHEFHTVRTASSWFAVKPSRSASARDLRYDFGLVALKRPAADGSWVDVVRPRPHTGSRPDSAGPVLLGPGGRALPDGTRSRESRGTVTVSGGYRSARGKWVSKGETFRFAPVGCGVRATFTRRRGGGLEYSVFFRQQPTLHEGTLSGGGTAVQASPRPAVTLRGGYASGVDSRLVRAVLRFPPGHALVRVTTCDG
jgi:hypothetical protein